MNDNSIRRITIVGGGVAGCVAAAGIAHALRGQGLVITVLEEPDGDQSAGRHKAEATLPINHAFNQRLGINEQLLMRETSASFSLGTQFTDWLQPGHRYFQPLGAHGASIEFVHFHNYAIKARQQGDETLLNAYSLCAAAASQGKFAHPVNDPNSILSTLVYAHHLDTQMYASFMRRHARANGANFLTATVVDVELNEEDGFIQSLTLDNGTSHSADFFIDCSGHHAVLLEQALKTGHEDWSHWLPANRMVTASSTATDIPPCASVRGLDSGWHQQIPMQQSLAHRLVFNDRHMDDGAATQVLQDSAPQSLNGEPEIHDIACGIREKFWAGNCVGLGSAAGFMEPLEGTFLALLQSGLMRLISMFPDKSCNRLIADEYNEVTRAEYENIRDFLVLHYRAGQLRDTAFWRDFMVHDVPDSLAHKIRLFSEHGQVAFYEEESFPDTSWASVWLGQGQWPAGYDPILDNYDFERLQGRFEQMKQIIAQAAGSMPAHKDYLTRYCPAPGKG